MIDPKKKPIEPSGFGLHLRRDHHATIKGTELELDQDGNPMVSLTKQSFKDDCDINVILDRFARAGQFIPQVSDATYGDFANIPSYQEALDMVIRAEEAFDSLPAAVRKAFDNDPAKFVAEANDPQNLQKFIDLGLAPKKDTQPTPAPTPDPTPKA